MRFSVYKSMLDMCNTLKEAVSYMYENNNADLVDGCLDMLVSINATLAEYNLTDFESIIELSNGFNSQNLNLPEIYNKIADLENEIKTKVKYKLHILFVAELAGKWDSMASVYEAMKKREDCEVEVVIQPIFRAVKMPDGSVKSDVILNDYLTPMGIENIPYDRYKFSERLPDITFFSQPYESCTIEKFWPENMSQYTKVVYLPYYTAMTVNRKMLPATYDSFFKANTEKFSWKIVTQSEYMRQHYRNLGSNKGVNSIVTGLPKWDYPMHISKENTPCPEEWKSKISGRKVFLWNTHFSVETKGSDFLNKGDEFLNVFIKNKDIALIWRPHPMTETIFKLYMSEQLPKYNALKEKIAKSENIVIDTEPTYDAAFAYSDALISDLSSMLDQFMLMNKPVLMVTSQAISEAREKYECADGLYDFAKIPFANAINDKKDFIEKISNGIDEWSDKRKEFLTEYFTLADGKCGERVVESILKAFKDENEDREIEINLAKTALVIGNTIDSDACIKQFQKNGVDFTFAKEFVEADCQYKTVSFFDVDNNSFDLFVVTAEKSTVIKDMLVEEVGVSKEKIISFWQLYNASLPSMVCDKIMLNPEVDEYEGLITGLSHAEVGFIPSMLDAKFCNLAISSQDIYGMYKNIEYCLANYPKKIKNLKYAVIDLCDYHYFNYDNSLSKTAVNYWAVGGYNHDGHNFANNKLYDISFDDVMNLLGQSKIDGINEIDIANWNVNFPDVYECAGYKGFSSIYKDLSNRVNIVNETMVNNFEYNRGVIKNVFDKTIKENQRYLEALLELLKQINPEVEIYFTLIPKYVEVEAMEAEQMLKHKSIFFNILDDLSKKFEFTFLDFKECSNIKYNRNYFNDANHLNYYGAIKFTNEFNRMIFG